MNERRTIVLLGYRGSGKSTVGRALAKHLRMTFLDTDDSVVARFDGRSIAEVWAHEGEAHFRAIEAQVVADAVSEPGRVVALGGGAMTEHPAGRAAVEQADVLRVYLSAPADVLARRIAGDANTHATRPRLTANASVTEEITSVLARRDPVYRGVADAVVDVAQGSIEDIVQRVVSRVEAD